MVLDIFCIFIFFPQPFYVIGDKRFITQCIINCDFKNMATVAAIPSILERLDRLDGKGDDFFKGLYSVKIGTSGFETKTGPGFCLSIDKPHCADFYDNIDLVSTLASYTPTGQAKIAMSYQNTGNDFKPRRQWDVRPSGSNDEIYAYFLCMAILRWYIKNDGNDYRKSISELMSDSGRGYEIEFSLREASGYMPSAESGAIAFIGPDTNALFARLGAEYSMDLSAFMVRI